MLSLLLSFYLSLPNQSKYKMLFHWIRRIHFYKLRMHYSHYYAEFFFISTRLLSTIRYLFFLHLHTILHIHCTHSVLLCTHITLLTPTGTLQRNLSLSLFSPIYTHTQLFCVILFIHTLFTLHPLHNSGAYSATESHSWCVSGYS